jgi:hypothetical protein
MATLSTAARHSDCVKRCVLRRDSSWRSEEHDYLRQRTTGTSAQPVLKHGRSGVPCLLREREHGPTESFQPRTAGSRFGSFAAST